MCGTLFLNLMASIKSIRQGLSSGMLQFHLLEIKEARQKQQSKIEK